MAVAIYYGGVWWKVDAADYAEDIYHPLNVDAHLSGDVLDLQVHPFRTRYSADYNGNDRSNTDFLPDHGHLMHLYAIREPQMDAVFHLHPDMASPGDFRMVIPAMPAGNYKLYGDVVHANGFPETLVSTLTIRRICPFAPAQVFVPILVQMTRQPGPRHSPPPIQQHLQTPRRLHHGLG